MIDSALSKRSRVADRCNRFLAASRRRARGQTACAAVLRMVSLLFALVVVEFFLDYNLDLPVPVRAVLLLALAVVLVRGIARFTVRPLREAPGHDALARKIEETYPDLRGEFLTAVQLGRPGNPAARYVSQELIHSVEANMSRATDALDPRELFPRRLLLLPAGACLGVTLLLGLTVLRNQDVLSQWRDRLLLRSVPWPRQVHLSMVQPAGSTVLLARGDDLLVEVAVVSERKARQVELVCRWPENERTEVMTGWGDEVYRHTLANVTRPLSLYARGGDGRTRTVDVKLVARPRIEELRAVVTSPAYTGVEPQVSEDGTIKALVRSTVAFTAWARPRVRAAELRIFPRGAEEPARTTGVSVEAEADRSRLEGAFAVTVSGYYTFTLESEEGFKNPGPSRYQIRAVLDQVPKVAIATPGPTEECTRDAEVFVTGTISDDWGVASARFAYSVRGPEEEEAGPQVSAELAVPEIGKPVPIDYVMRLSDVAGLGEGSTVLWFVEAKDVPGGAGASPEHALIIVPPETLRDILFDRLTSVREDLNGLAELQRKARDRFADLARDSRTTPTLSPDAASPVARVRAEELSLLRRLQAAAEELGRLRDRMVRNLVGDLREQKWIGSLGEEVKALAEEKVTPLVEQVGALAEEVNAGSASPAKLPPLMAQQQDVEFELRDLVDRMAHYGDINQLIRQLQDILQDEEVIKESTRELMGRE